MTVAELITWLQQQPQDAEMLLHDPDTEWFLELEVGPNRWTQPDEVPPGSVAVHAEYGG